MLKAISAAETAAVIPFTQLGSEADKKGGSTASSITPTATGARLKALMQDLEGEATPQGLWLTSTAEEDVGKVNRFRVKAAAFGRSSSIVMPSTGTVQASQQSVVWLRPGLIEEYSVSSDGVRQDFVVMQRPAGAGEPLALDLEITGARVEEADYGVKVTVTATGRELAYSRLKVSDAAGKELKARFHVLNPGQLRITVQDNGAVDPVRIDPTFSDADWVALNTSIPGANNYMLALAVDSSGNLYAGGTFTAIGTVLANHIAKWNGSTWSALGSGMNDYVYELAVSGSDVYAGGVFTTAGGASANNIAKWDGTTWSALGSGMNGGVYALGVSGSDLYAGGNFTTAGLMNANYIAKWDGNAWSPLGSGTNGTIQTLVISGSELYTGGNFTAAGGTTANYVAKWDGTTWSPLGSGVGGSFASVNALAASGSDLYAGGNFTTAGGITVNHIAKWNGSSWGGLGSGLNGNAIALAVHGSDLYAGGNFTQAGGINATNIAKWNGSSWSPLAMGTTGQVSAITASGSNVYAAGIFNIASGSISLNIARWNGSAWSALGSGMNTAARALAMIDTDLYVAGEFMTAGNSNIKYLAKWNGSSWSALGAGVNGGVLALTVSGSELYAAGWFTMAGGTSANRIAKWNGYTWTALGSGISGGGSPLVLALAVNGNDVYAGGQFYQAGGISVNRIARWNGSAWSDLGGGIGGFAFGTDTQYVYALQVIGGELYAGGVFSWAGGVNANNIAKWNGSDWSALGSGMSGTVNALAASGNDLYAGGGFASAGGSTVNRVAKWNGGAWSPLGLGVGNVFDSILALTVSGSDLYAGGSFTTAGGVSANRIAKWDGSAWSALGSGISGTVRALSADAGGHLFVGGDFLMAGTTYSPYLAQANLPLTALESWRRNYFGIIANSGNAADTFDADSDGLANMLEWACNSNPTSTSTLPVGLAPNGTDLEFSYQRSVSALDAGAVFDVEWSETLLGGSWSTAGVIQTILSDNGTVQQVKATLPAGSGGKRFVRLRVTSPP